MFLSLNYNVQVFSLILAKFSALLGLGLRQLMPLCLCLTVAAHQYSPGELSLFCLRCRVVDWPTWAKLSTIELSIKAQPVCLPDP